MSEIIVDCKVIKQNYFKLKGLSTSPVCAVVKANAYGHGLRAAREISGYADAVGVSSNQEALELCSFAKGSVLVIGAFSTTLLDEAVKRGVSITCDSESAVREVHLAGVRTGAVPKIHIKIDTGMHRLGVDIKEFNAVLGYALDRRIIVEGVFSHLACTDDLELTKFQYNSITTLTKGLNIVRHIANSAAFLMNSCYHLDMSRVGIALYCGAYGFKSALSFRAKVVAIRRVNSGECVGYSNAYIAERDTVVAVVNAGYADGIFRSLSNRGSVYINEKRCKIIGNICMDLFMVDITDMDEIDIGDYVYLISDRYSAEDMAYDAGTISYEILTRLGTRPSRVYINTGIANENKK